MNALDFNDYEVLPITKESLGYLPRATTAEEDERNLTEQQFTEIAGLTVEDVRSFVRAGMDRNPDGTFDLTACNEWWKRTYLRESLAEEFLLDILGEGAIPVKEIYELGTSEAFGFSERTLDRAKARLRITSRRDGKEWVWELPPTK